MFGSSRNSSLRFVTYFFMAYLTVYSNHSLAQNMSEQAKHPQSPDFLVDTIEGFQKNITSIDINQLNADTNVNHLTNKETKFIEGVFSTPVQVSIELLGLLTAIHKEYLRLEQELGQNELLQRITNRKMKEAISIEIPNVGKAELNAFGLGEQAVVFTKVVHYGTDRSYLFIPPEMDVAFIKKQIHSRQTSKEERKIYRELLQQRRYYMARQLVFSGSDTEQYKPFIAHPENINTTEEIRQELNQLSHERRWELFWDLSVEKPNTEMGGRDTTVLFYNDGKFQKEREKRPTSKVSLNYWKNYWRGIYEKPSRADVNMGLYSTGIQSVVSYLLGGPELAILSAIWGSVLGVYGKTYVNWLTANPSIRSKTIKSWIISMSFSYAYVAATKGWGALVAMDPSTLWLHLKYWSIGLANNLAKVHVQQIPFLRKVNGESHGEIKIRNISFPKAVFEQQNAYLGLFALKIADMADFEVQIPGIEYNVKLGKILLWTSIPFMEYVSLKYTERHQLPERFALREQWEKSKAFSIPYVMSLHEAMKKTLNFLKIPYQGNAFYYLDHLYKDSIKSFMKNGKLFIEGAKGFLGYYRLQQALIDLQFSIQEYTNKKILPNEKQYAENRRHYLEMRDYLSKKENSSAHNDGTEIRWEMTTPIKNHLIFLRDIAIEGLDTIKSIPSLIAKPFIEGNRYFRERAIEELRLYHQMQEMSGAQYKKQANYKARMCKNLFDR